MALPRDPVFDNTRAFFREGYHFVGNHCRQLGCDAFISRIMLRPVVCMMGEEAASCFYDGEHFTRVGAMPATTLRLLQDKGSVQTLDSGQHRRRKAMFMNILTGDSVERIGRLFEERWQAAQAGWRRRGRIVLHDEMTRLLCDVVCEWAGVPLTGGMLAARTHEMAAMIDGAGTVGPRAWKGLLLRSRAEHWARHAIARSRRSAPRDTSSPVDMIAHHRDEAGQLLDVRSAGVELLNVIRPTVAVARFITFAALALHEHPGGGSWVRKGPDARTLAFVQEVRRYYPFFPVIGGRVRRPFTWRAHDFAAGDWVLLGLYATNHDARLWKEPGCFRPERFLASPHSENDLVPQGAGDHRQDHRCPGEWITIELIRRSLKALLELNYTVPDQDLHVPKDRFPTCPVDGFRIDLG